MGLFSKCAKVPSEFEVNYHLICINRGIPRENTSEGEKTREKSFLRELFQKLLTSRCWRAKGRAGMKQKEASGGGKMPVQRAG